MSAGCFILAVAVLPWDVVASRWWTSGPLPGDVAKFITLSEVFAHGFGVAALLIAAWLLDHRQRKNWFRLVCSAYGSGLATHLFKISIGRTRPNEIKLETDVAGTFVGWLPAWTERDWSHLFDRSIQSFPSGHTATAVGLAIGLTYLYPRGRWLFTLLAIAAGLQRLQANAHFPSDVLAAAGIACVVGAILWKNEPSQ
ncbi:MAG: phosphatase PAP2 family protein [Planctomycetota bacterium]|nr:phosphatase PAP2 family protein [Planctomycetota bacterium]